MNGIKIKYINKPSNQRSRNGVQSNLEYIYGWLCFSELDQGELPLLIMY